MKISIRLGSTLVGGALAALLCVTACGGAPAAHDPIMAENASPSTAAPAGGSGGGATSVNGAALYSANCSSCHGDSKKHAAASNIQKAIDGNIGKMGSLKSLTAAQIDAIAAAP